MKWIMILLLALGFAGNEGMYTGQEAGRDVNPGLVAEAPQGLTEEPQATQQPDYEFSLKAFEKDPLLTVEYDEEEDCYIYFGSNKTFHFDPGYSQGYYCSFEPDILVLRSDSDIPYFRLWLHFFAEQWSFIEEIQIHIAGTTYTFQEVAASTETMENGDIKEKALIIINGESAPMMEAMAAHKGEKITVTLVGNAYDTSFVMSPKMLRDILYLYDAYRATDGVTQQLLDGLDGTPMTLVQEEGASPTEAPQATEDVQQDSKENATPETTVPRVGIPSVM